MRIHQDGASLRVRNSEDGVATLYFYGVVGRVEFVSLVSKWYSMRSRTPLAHITVLSSCVYAKTDLLHTRDILPREVLQSLCSRPTALVVPEDQLSVGQSYCLRGAIDGRVIGAFLSESDAHEWVLSRALALKAQELLYSVGQIEAPDALARKPFCASQGQVGDPAFVLGLAPSD